MTNKTTKVRHIHEVIIPQDRGEAGIPSEKPTKKDGLAAPVTPEKPRPSVESIPDRIGGLRSAGHSWMTDKEREMSTPSSNKEPMPSRLQKVVPTEKSLAEDEAKDIKRRQKYYEKAIEEKERSYNLRVVHGYTFRQLATAAATKKFASESYKYDLSFLDSDEYPLIKGKRSRKSYREVYDDILANRRTRYPTTVDELVECLPVAMLPDITEGEINFFVDLASNNYSKPQMDERRREGRYGTEVILLDSIIPLANRIIRRAWDLRLLNPNPEHKPPKSAGEAPGEKIVVDYDKEIAGMKRGSVPVPGQVVAGKRTYGDKDGRRPLDTFEGGRTHGPGQVETTDEKDLEKIERTKESGDVNADHAAKDFESGNTDDAVEDSYNEDSQP